MGDTIKELWVNIGARGDIRPAMGSAMASAKDAEKQFARTGKAASSMSGLDMSRLNRPSAASSAMMSGRRSAAHLSSQKAAALDSQAKVAARSYKGLDVSGPASSGTTAAMARQKTAAKLEAQKAAALDSQAKVAARSYKGLDVSGPASSGTTAAMARQKTAAKLEAQKAVALDSQAKATADALRKVENAAAIAAKGLAKQQREAEKTAAIEQKETAQKRAQFQVAALGAATVATHSAYGLGRAASPYAASRMDKAQQDLSAIAGTVFLPLIEGTTRFTRSVADVLNVMSPTGKLFAVAGAGAVSLISGFAALRYGLKLTGAAMGLNSMTTLLPGAATTAKGAMDMAALSKAAMPGANAGLIKTVAADAAGFAAGNLATKAGTWGAAWGGVKAAARMGSRALPYVGAGVAAAGALEGADQLFNKGGITNWAARQFTGGASSEGASGMQAEKGDISSYQWAVQQAALAEPSKAVVPKTERELDKEKATEELEKQTGLMGTMCGFLNTISLGMVPSTVGAIAGVRRPNNGR